jgi:hypothetical protein
MVSYIPSSRDLGTTSYKAADSHVIRGIKVSLGWVSPFLRFVVGMGACLCTPGSAKHCVNVSLTLQAFHLLEGKQHEYKGEEEVRYNYLQLVW